MGHAADRHDAYDTKAPRRPVNLTLNADLLSRVEAVTPDLSAMVEHLLGQYLMTTDRRRRDGRQGLDDVIGAVNIMHEQHGFLSDDFSTL